MTLNAEDVAYWYLRLNGFLCLRNFLVHGDTGGEVRTEIDVVGVRFKHRREHFRDPMIDDDWIEQTKRTIVVFCDAKTGARDINLPWQNRERKTMESFLAFVGIFPREVWDRVASELYTNGRSESCPDVLITCLLVHHDPQRLVSPRWNSTQVIQIERALSFIHRRFRGYRSIKRSHDQWEPSGNTLWDLYELHRRSERAFVTAGLAAIGAQQSGPSL